MAKMFAVEYSNGFKQEFTARNWQEAFNVINYGEGQRFFVKGDEVDAEDFYAAAQAGADAWFAKKSETHKRVRVLHGSSIACYVWKWVRK